MKFRFALLLLALVWVLPAWSQTKVNYKKLDRYIDQAVDDYGLAGLAVAVVQNDEVVFSKGYGLQHTQQKTAITGGSLFGIASLSKAFTAASIAMLVQDGELNWDDKVVDHLPQFQLADPYITSQMTVRDLLCHRSGLQTFDGDLLWYGTDYSRDEIIQRIRHRPLNYGHRERFGYQNIMYITAGELIPALTGKSWDDFVQERIFNPLGMASSNTSITKYKAEQNNLAYPHLKKTPIEVLNYDNSGGTAAINSCANDLSQWVRFWLNEGQVGEQRLLDPKHIKTVWSMHTPLNVSSFDASNGVHFKGYAMGWFIMDYQGKKVVHHGGGLPGYITKIALVPEEELGLIVLTNGMTSLPSALMYKIIDEHLGVKGKDWAKDFLAYEDPDGQAAKKAHQEREDARAKKTKPSHKLADYAGTYTDKMYGDATITLDKGQLTLTMEPTKKLFTSEMEHWHHNTFRVKFKDEFLPEGFVTFQLTSNGELEGFTIDLPNPDFHFFKLAFKK